MIEPKRKRTGLGESIASLVAISVALIFVFPIYWAFSQSLRNPIDTFTVAGFGIPWVNFTPTLGNWIDQLDQSSYTLDQSGHGLTFHTETSVTLHDQNGHELVLQNVERLTF